MRLWSTIVRRANAPRGFFVTFLTVVLLLPSAAPALAQAAASGQVGLSAARLFSEVAARAQTLAAEPYQEPERLSDADLGELDYDDFRTIRFRGERSLWRGESPFEAQFFHMGFLYKEAVQINLLEDGAVRRLAFDKGMFRYDRPGIAEKLPDGLGFAGFRLHYPLHRPDYKDEVAVFLGASYFRVLARNQAYGISARGLAIDTALPEGEEFPAFREFWLVRPAADATSITVLALMDSPSMTGAYRFVIRPGTRTVVDVDATLFTREDGHKVGVAPLTSMFLHGENSTQPHDDFRPEVHDSDGLLMKTGQGEWIWRPLSNPRSLRVSAFMDRNPAGFGLMQRDREFGHFIDQESHYHERPSLWIEPRESGWGDGSVQLVEIPSRSEVNDNVVAFWVFDQPFTTARPMKISYRLVSMSDEPSEGRLARVVRTRTGWGGVAGTGQDRDRLPDSVRRFVIDFKGGDLATLNNAQPVTARIETTAGTVDEVVVTKLPDGLWQVSYRLQGAEAQTADMRVYLELAEDRLTETWSYIYAPN